ncbi:hypothetical protein FE257_011366 [Aspergillus nanangensis]|uniref:trans-L-3-hydroxyproline dehydratase n=1 Tax=Aspergillus nanangensis TaxID=2582783 RepID=A0AAD4CH74_ASPNN|nr:hypothetical protein FE257_011366 [Aspergillus nanangensis]
MNIAQPFQPIWDMRRARPHHLRPLPATVRNNPSGTARRRNHHDHIRKCLIEEPRCHDGIYGAILRPDTELVTASEASIGVLFAHEGYYSSFVGISPSSAIPIWPTGVHGFHAPCGLLRITVAMMAAFASSLYLELSSEVRWPKLASDKTSVRLDVSYGGAFYAPIDVQ